MFEQLNGSDLDQTKVIIFFTIIGIIADIIIVIAKIISNNLPKR